MCMLPVLSFNISKPIEHYSYLGIVANFSVNKCNLKIFLHYTLFILKEY